MATPRGMTSPLPPVNSIRPRATRYRPVVVGVLVALLGAGCGGDDKGKSSSGGGGTTTAMPTTPPVNVVGPNLNGNWAGYYKSTKGKYENLRATITHVGRMVTIVTSMPPGIVKELIGRIDASGKMLLYDQYDNEDWTTLYGPASANSINLADFVVIDMSVSDTNVLILKR